MKLRWYQSEAVDAVWDSIRSGNNPCVVLPTGAGKSLVIAEICRQAIEKWGGRILILAHRKELLMQNAEKLEAIIPGVDVGVYSAGLNRRDTDNVIVVGGIQSVYSRAHEFGERHLVIIDEAHLIPQKRETMYQTFCETVTKCNPKARFVGLTATPYRLDSGSIVDSDSLLTDVCYDVPVSQLIEEEFLSRVTNRKTDCQVDQGLLDVRGGEYTEFSQDVAFAALSEDAVSDIVSKANETGRKSILVFCASVSQAETVQVLLAQKTGEQVECVTGETPALFRDSSLKRFANREFRWLVNVSVLTTGFDAPVIDCLAVLRSTMSPGLFAQIVGRGLRLYPGKTECIVLDYGRNIARHGAIDSPSYGVRRKDEDATKGVAPTKACADCGGEMPIAATSCPYCGMEQPVRDEPKVTSEADENSKILESQSSEPKLSDVESVQCWQHTNKRDHTKPDTLCVHYELGDGEFVREWVCFDHPESSFAKNMAWGWWNARSVAPTPRSVHSALAMINAGACRHPNRVFTTVDGKWTKIVSVSFAGEKPKFDAERFYLIESKLNEPVAIGDDFNEDELPF